MNSWVPAEMEGIHDVYYGTALPPNRKPIQIARVDDRIGQTTYRVDPAKVVAVVETHARDAASPLTAPDAVSEAIAGHVLEFFDYEVRAGRLPADSLLPLQAGIRERRECCARRAGPRLVQEPDLLLRGHPGQHARPDHDGTVAHASSTALALSEAGIEELVANIEFYRHHITLRPQEISNHPEVVRRLGVIAMNGMLGPTSTAT